MQLWVAGVVLVVPLPPLNPLLLSVMATGIMGLDLAFPECASLLFPGGGGATLPTLPVFGGFQ